MYCECTSGGVGCVSCPHVPDPVPTASLPRDGNSVQKRASPATCTGPDGTLFTEGERQRFETSESCMLCECTSGGVGCVSCPHVPNPVPTASLPRDVSSVEKRASPATCTGPDGTLFTEGERRRFETSESCMLCECTAAGTGCVSCDPP